jgi:hypothetical protein
VARAGKDTFAAILERKIAEQGKTSLKIALASPLKKDCAAFLERYLNVDVYTQIKAEKDLIRPLLVWYGDAQRKRTNGRHWIEIANKKIDETDHDYYIITDIRYDAYEKDELYWVKNERGGVVCHVSKWFTESIPPISDFSELRPREIVQFVQPANEHEQINDPKVKDKADFVVEWPHVLINPGVDLLTHPVLNKYVDDFIATIKLF